MNETTSWDWEVREKCIADLGAWKSRYAWVEEPYVSPDGEKIAAVIKLPGEETFSLCENGIPWESSFDRVWYLRFTPDNRLTAFVSEIGGWSLAVDGRTSENKFDFAWDTHFSADGKKIVHAAQKEGKYFAVCNDIPWPTAYESLTGLMVDDAATKTAAVVQTVPLKEAEIFKFQEGCYSVAVDGAAWNRNFVNVWDIAFSPDGRRVAAGVRTSLYDYTIAIDGVTWEKNFASVWEPQFCPCDGSVTAPVRSGGSWFLARDGELLWSNKFVQLWHHVYSPDGKKIAAIVAPRFGRWTVALEGIPWKVTFGDMVTDAIFSPDGKKIAFLGKEKEKWTVVVDQNCWGSYDMAWRPIFSPDGEKCAAKVEKNGLYAIVVNGKPLKQEFAEVWDPVFSPDSDKILIKAIKAESNEHKYIRSVVRLQDITG